MADDDWHRRRAGFTYRSPDGWTATGSVVRTRRRGVVISDVAIQGPADEEGAPGAVTSTALREIPTGEIVAAAMASGHLPEYEHAQPAAPSEPKRQPGRQPLSDDLLRDVAVRYLAETASGQPRGAVQRLAEHYDKPAQTVSRWVMRARADGWLGPAVPGREGGEPGPRLGGFIRTREARLATELEGRPIPPPGESESYIQSGASPTVRIDPPTTE
jgi:hypothetical protein